MLTSFYWNKLLWIDMWLKFEKNFLYLTLNQLTSSQLTLSQLSDLTYVITMIYIWSLILDSKSSFYIQYFNRFINNNFSFITFDETFVFEIQKIIKSNLNHQENIIFEQESNQKFRRWIKNFRSNFHFFERIEICDERTSNSTFDKINIELTSLFYHIEC